MNEPEAVIDRRIVADLSLDLDNKWSYLKTHGDPQWEQYPSYLPQVIPQVLAVLAQHRLRITVFVVGQDAAEPAHRESLQSLVTAGHELGNHSFHHEPWLQRYSRQQLEEEFDRAEEALRQITQQPMLGFRGPGYSFSPDVLEILIERGYRFDASTFPTFIGPLARSYYFFHSRLTRQQAEDRQQLFGDWREGFRSLRPYQWKTERGALLEIPVTTLPLLRIPFHFSYILYLATYSELLAKSYFTLCLRMCQMFRLGPSLLLHPLDFLGGDEVGELDFFPAMKMSGQRKRELVTQMLGRYADLFRVVPMSERATWELQHRRSSLAQKPLGPS